MLKHISLYKGPNAIEPLKCVSCWQSLMSVHPFYLSNQKNDWFAQILNYPAIDFDPRAEELALWGIICSDSNSTCSSSAAFSSFKRFTICRKNCLSFFSYPSSCFTSSSSSRVLFLLDEDFIRLDALPFSTNWHIKTNEWLTWEVHAALKSLCEFRAHFNYQIALLF